MDLEVLADDGGQSGDQSSDPIVVSAPAENWLNER